MDEAQQQPLVLAVIEGTTRVQRESIKASRYIADFARRQPGVEVIFVDPVDFNLPGDGNDPEGKDPRYTDITARADAFFIVTPEYNHSFPGSLKRLLDSELANYNHKPVAFAGVSNGGWGGTRAVESLVPAVRETGLVVMSWDVFFPRVQDIFDADGAMLPEHQPRYERNVQKLLDELLWFAHLLKRGRAERDSLQPEAK
jgi:NAD(P)H-dependent FMN reductase